MKNLSAVNLPKEWVQNHDHLHPVDESAGHLSFELQDSKENLNAFETITDCMRRNCLIYFEGEQYWITSLYGFGIHTDGVAVVMMQPQNLRPAQFE